MKTRQLINTPRFARAFFGAIGLALLLPFAGIAEGSEVEVKAFDMKVKGTSSLHDWESEATSLTVEGGLGLSDNQLALNENFAVTVPVKGLVSPHKRMDKLTYEALKADKHPEIQYKLNSLTPIDGGKTRAKGDLTIAGQTRPLEMEVATTTNAGGELVVTGSAPIKMTDFGMKPPSLMLGAIKVGDDVQVEFSLTLIINSNNS